MMLSLHTIDHSKLALEEHGATDGFLFKRGVSGPLGLTQPRMNLQFMVIITLLCSLHNILEKKIASYWKDEFHLLVICFVYVNC